MNKRDRTALCRKLNGMLKTVEDAAYSFEPDQDEGRTYILMGYAFRTLDLIGGCISSIQTKQYSSVPILLRSAVESFLFFINTARHDDYHELIFLHSLKESLTLLKKIEEIESLQGYAESQEYLNLREKRQQAIEERRQWRAEYNQKCGHIAKRFEAAGMGELYYSMYSHLCGAAHSDVRALEDFNLTLVSDEWCFVRRAIPNTSFNLYIHVIIDLLVALLNRLNEFFDLGKDNDVNKFREYSETIKDKYAPEPENEEHAN